MDLDSYFDSLGFDSFELEPQDVKSASKPQALKDLRDAFRLPEVCLKTASCFRREPVQPLDPMALEHATYEMRLLCRQLDQSLLLPTSVSDAEQRSPEPRRTIRLPRRLRVSLVVSAMLALLGGLAVVYGQRCSEDVHCLVTQKRWLEVQKVFALQFPRGGIPQNSLLQPMRSTETVQMLHSSEQRRDPFREAVNQAMSAAKLTQTAKTVQQWNIVAHQWLEAIELMRSVPPSSAKYSIAVQKAGEYARNLAYAQRNVERAQARRRGNSSR